MISIGQKGTMIWALQLNLDHVGKLVQQSLGETVHFGSSKPTQSPKTNRDSSGRPVAQEVVVGVLQEEPSSSDRPGRLVSREEQHVRNHDSSGKPEREEVQHTVQENDHLKSRDNVDKFDLATDDANVDYSVSGIPEEAVKRSEKFYILQLIRRITRHPQKAKPSRTISTKNNRSMHSALSRRRRSRKSGTIKISKIINTESTSGALNRWSSRMEKLAKEDHSYKASKAEIEFYRGNWWLHSNVARVDSMPVRHEPEF